MNDKSLQKGTQLNSQADTYTIDSVIGSGGFGITYKAWVPTRVRNIDAKAFVAIKEHFPASDCERSATTSSITFSNTARERVLNSLHEFIDEAQCLQRIAGLHPNIVNVNEVFEANNTAYYVMEYLEGETLKQYVDRKGHLSLNETLSILLPVIEAVATLHKNKFTHLDFKPSNIMLSNSDGPEKRPVLIDFGLAKHYNPDGSATATMMTTGFSEGYAPIEQYSGITKFSPQVDVYAIAATMLFCLTGQRPPRAVEMSQSVLESIIPGSVPQKLRKVLMMAMAFQATDRLPNAHQLYISLKPIAEAQGIAVNSAGVTLYPGGDIRTPVISNHAPVNNPDQTRMLSNDNDRTVFSNPSDNTIISTPPVTPPVTPANPRQQSYTPEYEPQKYKRTIAQEGTPTWIWVIIVGLLIALAIAGALVYNSFNNSQTDNTDQTEKYTAPEIEAGISSSDRQLSETKKEQEQPESQVIEKNYLSKGEVTPDLAFHSLSGPVKSCKNQWGATLPYNSDGDWTGNYSDNLGKRTFIRDGNGRIVTEKYYSSEYGPGEINYSWDGDRITSMSDDTRNQQVYFYYNSDGSLSSQTNYVNGNRTEMEFYNEKRDSHGNWVSRQFRRTSDDGSSSSGTQKRTISYYQ